MVIISLSIYFYLKFFENFWYSKDNVKASIFSLKSCSTILFNNEANLFLNPLNKLKSK